MDQASPNDRAAPGALTPRLGWLVGGGLALMAAGSLATALALRPPLSEGDGPSATSSADRGASAASAPHVGTAGRRAVAEPRETIVSTLSPPPGPTITRQTPLAATSNPIRRLCADCAVVQSVVAIERGGPATGLGAVAGAVAGGLLGSQVGGGSGRDAMAVIGAVGGGVAGHHAERRLRTTTEYRVRLQMDDGSTRTLSHPTRLASGDAVRVDGDRIVAVTPRSPVPTTRTAQAEPTQAAPAEAPPPRPRSMAEAKRL